jgi:U3 small nucleolar RNA-associated protein 22
MLTDGITRSPQSLFQEKDYLNGRFFHKRAFYLASIAAAIQRKKNGLDVDILYESRSNNPRFTTLILRPRKGSLPVCS